MTIDLQMTADDWLDSDERVNKATAAHWLQKHGFPLSEFIETNGDHAEYLGADVLEWMGY